MLNAAQVQEYLQRSGDGSFFWDWPLIETESGWFNYQEYEGRLVVGQAQGDVRELMDAAQSEARRLGLQAVRWGTRRRPDAYRRLFGARVVGYVLEVPTWAE